MINACIKEQDAKQVNNRLSDYQLSRLTERFALTVYDAAYLELAQRRSLPLATLNGRLHPAAQALGVSLCGAG